MIYSSWWAKNSPRNRQIAKNKDLSWPSVRFERWLSLNWGRSWDTNERLRTNMGRCWECFACKKPLGFHLAEMSCKSRSWTSHPSLIRPVAPYSASRTRYRQSVRGRFCLERDPSWKYLFLQTRVYLSWQVNEWSLLDFEISSKTPLAEVNYKKKTRLALAINKSPSQQAWWWREVVFLRVKWFEKLYNLLFVCLFELGIDQTSCMIDKAKYFTLMVAHFRGKGPGLAKIWQMAC